MREMLLGMILTAIIVAMSGCHSTAATGSFADGPWAIAIHGGAGTIDKGTPEAEKAAYVKSLAAALTIGRDELARGGSALDACEKVVRFLEDDPLFNAGKGAVFTYEGTHELDASIMDGSTLKCGAVAGVKTVKNPISLARLVMEKSPHVLLMGDGAEQFAGSMGVERVENSYFNTPKRREAWKKKREEIDRKAPSEPGGASPGGPRSGANPPGLAPSGSDRYGTVGCVALDSHGRLAAATSTGGTTCKRWGRVGDTPVIGAGNYADANCAVSCTGTGEEFIRHGVARQIALIMELQGATAAQAADRVVNHRLKPDDGGVIVVSRTGEIAAVFNSEGMFRGAADSRGRFDVAIWEKPERAREQQK